MAMGPPPKHPSQRRRTNPTIAMTQLPAEGRRGEAPEWPLAPAANETEAEIWEELWRTPMAVQWERLGWARDVAVFTRFKALAERGTNFKAAAEARQWSDRLGLSPLALLRLRWEIAPADVDEPATPAAGMPSNVRSLFKAG